MNFIFTEKLIIFHKKDISNYLIINQLNEFILKY